MGDLENHFGDDASLDEDVNKNILTFLLKNSAETSTMQASWNFLNSIGDKDIIALSKTSYWERKHKKIPKEVFKNEKVKSVANCKACHSDIEKGLIDHIRNFLLELGNGFAFMGSQYRVELAGEEFFIDLLMYHVKLKSYVVIELKAGKFKPEYVGKLGFYTTAIDHEVKDESDNPTIGLILCTQKNDAVVK